MKISDEEKQELLEMLESGEAYEMLKQQSDVETKNLKIEALYKGNDLLAVMPQFDDILSSEAVNILLNVLITHAREVTDLEDFIKTIVSTWGTYDEMENE